MLPPSKQRRLIRAAIKARDSAIAPYSKFHVGAALLTKKDELVTGANVESVSYGLTCCAERIALFKALTEGVRGFVAIAVAAHGPISPCGACRQLLAEYASDAEVFLVDVTNPKNVVRSTVAELLPLSFCKFDA